ncbi:MAG: hypothetical protein LBO72_11180 [Helicobacteraceae bacterium]|nr:hypothetical protein [Helicobacteraceae bacterium]
MGCVAKTFSLDVDVVTGIKRLADAMRIKQGALVQLMYERFLDDNESDEIDDETSDSYSAALEQIRRGEYFTLEQVEAQINARKAAV